MFVPRPDQPYRFDQQASCFNSRHPGLTLILGGNGSGKTIVAANKVVSFLNENPVHSETSFCVIAEDRRDALWQWDQAAKSVRPYQVPEPWKIRFVSYRDLFDSPGVVIGGFLFVDQPPVGVVQEAMSRCRMGFLGGQIAEFTPLSVKLCADWKRFADDIGQGGLYRLNTQCAVEADHVSRQWFDTFFQTIPPSQFDTRMWGAWPEIENADDR